MSKEFVKLSQESKKRFKKRCGKSCLKSLQTFPCYLLFAIHVFSSSQKNKKKFLKYIGKDLKTIDVLLKLIFDFGKIEGW